MPYSASCVFRSQSGAPTYFYSIEDFNNSRVTEGSEFAKSIARERESSFVRGYIKGEDATL